MVHANATGSILRDWVIDLPLRHQGVLIAAVRGCDSTPKEDSSKPIIRALRYVFMRPFDEREVDKPRSFMTTGFTEADQIGFLRDWDHYPIHYVQHLMHAAEVVGYCHPDQRERNRWSHLYRMICHKLHVNPETPSEMHVRLTEDRIRSGTVSE